jgi:hypothetical protein
VPKTFDICPTISADGSSWQTDHAGVLGAVEGAIHEDDVLDLLTTMAGTWAGNDLFDAITREHDRANLNIVIVPYNLADRRRDPANAFSSADNFRASAPSGELIFQGGNDNPNTPQDERYRTFGRGTGGGSSTHVHFSTDITFNGTIGTAPDEILFHELVHSMREMQGEEQSIPTGLQDRGYDDDEEFIAVLLTNIYLSEKDPNAPLRKDHHGFQQLPDDESDSVGFLVNNAENLFWIKFLFAEEFDTFTAIAANTMATFNPIRVYLSDPAFFNALPGPGEPPTNVYNVQPGDSLSRIAQLFYNDASKWPVIYAANRDVIGPNPNLILPGQSLDIP